ncbi:flagellar biosynthetic protein FliR [Tropicibacter naphthalenivorans]|uniref:Flagellar biosynthesis protein FliR n=1 Tax=Tropicibacter naphthalenivorans TaxID=441103 RepID=A0A0P1GDH8_9RHOB|nr:flagellar biosynthetic protein FliR [Tropicibacter naphthalenivorans]CUH79700.1 flagellar biosynthesis protein FliR [Tropicibacter naphthalenivorans]SMC74557.1 flagellar biosynthetic protein FliR [Tropicibacter naphthalenivorans]
MIALLPLVDMLTDSAWAALIVFLRAGAVMAALPGLGEQVISTRVRLVLAIMLTLIVAPAVTPAMDLPEPNFGTFVFALATETISGLFLGVVLRLFILAIETAGAIAAQSTSLSQLLGNNGTDPMPAIGHILTTAALALLMATGFHVKAAAFLVISYDMLPAMQFPNPSDIAEAGRERVTESFALAFSLAAPFVIMSVIYNLTLGVINKAMPQLMVAFVGAPVITFGAISLLTVAAPLMLSVWLSALEAFLAVPFR